MTLGLWELLLYAGALFILFATPGPVWVAVIARALSSGFNGVWPLALGVVVGDVLWPLLAIFGISLLVAVYADFLVLLRYAGAAIFLIMGIGLIRHADKVVGENRTLTKPGMWAGFTAGLLVILGNPKAILFYMGVLPGFFDLSTVTGWDIAVICAISAAVPLGGNLVLGIFLDRVRAFLTARGAVRRLNQISGVMLIVVGVLIVLF